MSLSSTLTSVLKLTLITIVLFASAEVTNAQVTYDGNGAAASNKIDVDNVSIPSFSVPAGVDRLLVVAVDYLPVATSVESVTFDGVNLTHAVTDNEGSASLEIWYLTLVDGGEMTGNINATLDGLSNSTRAGAASFQNVDPAEPIGNIQTSGIVFVTSSSLTVSTTINNGAVDAIYAAGFAGGLTPGSLQTELFSTFQGNYLSGSFQLATGSSTQMDWSSGASTPFVHAAIEINCSCNTPQVINGTLGDDVLNGGEANDTLYGDAGDDVLFGRGGNDMLYGDVGELTITFGNDEIYGGNGDDTLYGDAGNDILNGGEGNDLLNPGSGDDYVHGGSGFDEVELEVDLESVVVTSEVTLVSGELQTTFTSIGQSLAAATSNQSSTTGKRLNTAQASSNTMIYVEKLIGTPFDDTFTGAELNDIFDGSAGNDIIFGESGNDTLTGGEGNDSLNGGEGGDSYNLNAADLLGHDQITDSQGHDKLEFMNFGFERVASATHGEMGSLVINFTDGGSLTIEQQFLNNNLGIERLEVGDCSYKFSKDSSFESGTIQDVVGGCITFDDGFE